MPPPGPHPHILREVWNIDQASAPVRMKVCPDASSKYRNWREQTVVTWQQESILYAVGCTHTIDGQNERRLIEPQKTRIADIIQNASTSEHLRALASTQGSESHSSGGMGCTVQKTFTSTVHRSQIFGQTLKNTLDRG